MFAEQSRSAALTPGATPLIASHWGTALF